ncbi:hypothetical protein ABLE94_02895 [Gordonia sp. VNK1]|uniref:hypothetical protein n=1 Tax=Gordonia oleivorans TaxID=3156618 RepID=UPI0032B55B9B
MPYNENGHPAPTGCPLELDSQPAAQTSHDQYIGGTDNFSDDASPLSYDDANSLRYQLHGIELPEGIDRDRFVALLTAGVRDCLIRELDALAEKRARKSAALVVADAKPWGEVGRAVAQRRAWLVANPWAKRVIA